MTTSPSSSSPLPAFLSRCQARVADTLQQQLAQQASPYAAAGNSRLASLRAACLYSTGNGGKRLRPALFYATANSLNPDTDSHDLDQIAAALEALHCYSLVHDDLPAMDNDELRRGKPTCHIAFDEATAILAGDGLLTFAFELLASTRTLPPSVQIRLVRTLAEAGGNHGMVGGQMIDLESTGSAVNLAQLEEMHRMKTGALIRASVVMGALAAGATTETIAALDRYASAIGLAFQVQDDILDIESDTATLGKKQGADLLLNKSTYPALLGLEGAKEKAADLVRTAHEALAPLQDDLSLLHALADYIVVRNH